MGCGPPRSVMQCMLETKKKMRHAGGDVGCVWMGRCSWWGDGQQGKPAQLSGRTRQNQFHDDDMAGLYIMRQGGRPHQRQWQCLKK